MYGLGVIRGVDGETERLGGLTSSNEELCRSDMVHQSCLDFVDLILRKSRWLMAIKDGLAP